MTDLIRVSNLNLIWLAGLLEGEGNFCYKKRSKDGVMVPAIRLQMCDRDVVERAAFIIAGPGKTVAEIRPRNERCQPSFRTQIMGHPALDLMRQLQPHMGIRRSERIEELLNSEYALGASRRSY